MKDVIIAGAGPVGLSLALALGRAGKAVVLFEKEPRLREHSRAPVIWPRTQEILAGLGVLDSLLAAGMPTQELTVVDADREKKLLHVSFRELRDETRFPQLLILPQDKTERLLLNALAALPSVQVIFDAEVSGYMESTDSVRVEWRRTASASETQTEEARFLIGCDGAHSRVREFAGAKLSGITYSYRAALADIAFEDKKNTLFPRFSRRRGVFCVAIKIEPTLWRLIFIYPAGDARSLDDRVAVSAENLFPGIDYKKIWQSEFHLHQRVASCFVRNRLALAGDAAHLNSPVGGQGMNAGIQDTEVLARCLLQALEHNEPSLLRNYETERRRAVSKGVNRFTDLLTRILFFGNGRFMAQLFSAVNILFRVPGVRKAFLRNAAMLPRTR